MVKLFRFLALGILVGACSGSDAADRLYKEGQTAAHAEDILHAALRLSRATPHAPATLTYSPRQSALRAITEFAAEQRLAPDSAAAATTPLETEALTGGEILEAREALPPTALAASPERKSFDLKGDARMIFETVAGAYGLQVIFDREYQSPAPFTFRMTDAGYREALRGLETEANSFVVPVTGRLALVSRDTAQKRAELSPVMALEIPIPERFSVQEAQEMVTAVQQTLEIRRLTVDPLRRIVYVRDQVSKVYAARQMFASLSQLRAQVEVELEFISVEKNSSLGYGLTWPTSFPLVNFGSFLQNAPSIPAGFTKFLAFGGGATFLGLGITDAAAFATVSRGSSESLFRGQILSMDGQAATLHVGDRYPIITQGYYGNATGTGQVYSPPPTVNFEDLGLVFKVTPTVHDEGEVTLDLDTEFKVLGAASSISGIPIIGNRKFAGKVRLKQGEWAVIAGLVQSTDSESRSGIAGLSSIPWLGRLFSQSHHDKDSSEVLIIVKPRLVNLPPWENVPLTIWVGTETRPITLF